MSQKDTDNNKKKSTKIPITSKPGLDYINKTMMIKTKSK